METQVEYNAGKKEGNELRIAIYETTEKIVEGAYGDFYNTFTRKKAIEKMIEAIWDAIYYQTIGIKDECIPAAEAALESLLRVK